MQGVAVWPWGRPAWLLQLAWQLGDAARRSEPNRGWAPWAKVCKPGERPKRRSRRPLRREGSETRCLA
eukprot:705598-Amphidinium_carterae.1